MNICWKCYGCKGMLLLLLLMVLQKRVYVKTCYFATAFMIQTVIIAADICFHNRSHFTWNWCIRLIFGVQVRWMDFVCLEMCLHSDFIINEGKNFCFHCIHNARSDYRRSITNRLDFIWFRTNLYFCSLLHSQICMNISSPFSTDSKLNRIQTGQKCIIDDVMKWALCWHLWFVLCVFN